MSGEDREGWVTLCPPNEYRVVPPSSLPSVIPDRLRAKINSCLVVSSGDGKGTIYYMVNLNRVDEADSAIDQEPFGFAFVGNDTVTSGCFIHHGDWEGRTRYPPQQFWEHIEASGIHASYGVTSIPNAPAGPVAELNIQSQNEAFQRIVQDLKAQVDAARLSTDIVEHPESGSGH